MTSAERLKVVLLTLAESHQAETGILRICLDQSERARLAHRCHHVKAEKKDVQLQERGLSFAPWSASATVFVRHSELQLQTYFPSIVNFSVR